MQGYILNINRVKDEDLIVSILTPNKLKTLYRFYGARHSTINLGYKIDFEAIRTNSSMAMLRNVLHLAQKWNMQTQKFYIWQQVIKLFYKHLKDVVEIDQFYFNLLDKMSDKWDRQNSQRVAVEAYIEILEYEGRLHDDFVCFVCEERIDRDLSLARGFLPAHTSCIFANQQNKAKIENLFQTKSTLFLEDSEVLDLWNIINEGF